MGSSGRTMVMLSLADVTPAGRGVAVGAGVGVALGAGVAVGRTCVGAAAGADALPESLDAGAWGSAAEGAAAAGAWVGTGLLRDRRRQRRPGQSTPA